MDEILIEDKKYVSSKRAAKVTGYAKDYIGQLCREGRVPARFVGRNWYVLESAIQDHRFGVGESDIKPEKTPEAKEVVKTDVVTPPTWESPRYEAISADVLPTINQLQEVDDEKQETAPSAMGNLEESWQAWFNNFDNKAPAPTSEVGAPTESVGEVEEIKVENDVPIHIHTIYQLPPEALLPHKNRDEEIEDMPQTPRREGHRFSRVGMIALQTTGILLATIMAIFAIAGTGYLDKYIISDSQVSIIAGAVLYNK